MSTMKIGVTNLIQGLSLSANAITACLSSVKSDTLERSIVRVCPFSPATKIVSLLTQASVSYALSCVEEKGDFVSMTKRFLYPSFGPPGKGIIYGSATFVDRAPLWIVMMRSEG